jgi:opacity protein-like surface antigen
MKPITLGALLACLSMSSVVSAQTTPEQTPPVTPPQTEPTIPPETTPPQTEPVPPTPPAEPTPNPPTNTTIINNPPLEPVVVTPTEPSEKHEWFSSQVGLELGGGYADFTPSSAMENATNGGGAWDVRMLVGAHSPVGFELGYVGTANGLHIGGTLMSTAAEGNLRLATPTWIHMPAPVQLYGFGGAGVNRFDIVNAAGDLGAGSVSFTKTDTNFVLPFGGGFQFNVNPHFLLDARFTYRAMFDARIADRASGLDMMTATGRLGYVS